MCGLVQHCPCWLTLAKQLKTQRILNGSKDLTCLFTAVSFRDSPNLAEIAEIFCHKTQPVNLDENITEWTLILNSLYSAMPRNFRKQCAQDKAWASKWLRNISQGILMAKSEKAITLLASTHDLSSGRGNIQFLGQLQKKITLSNKGVSISFPVIDVEETSKNTGLLWPLAVICQWPPMGLQMPQLFLGKSSVSWYGRVRMKWARSFRWTCSRIEHTNLSSQQKDSVAWNSRKKGNFL